MIQQDVFYKEFSNARWNWWTYSDGVKVTLQSAWAVKQVERRNARVVLVA